MNGINGMLADVTPRVVEFGPPESGTTIALIVVVSVAVAVAVAAFVWRRSRRK